MATTSFEIVEADWPEGIPAPKKAILDFLASGLKTGEIKGQKDFLVQVRRAAKSSDTLRDQVDLKMMNNRMFIRRKDNVPS